MLLPFGFTVRVSKGHLSVIMTCDLPVTDESPIEIPGQVFVFELAPFAAAGIDSSTRNHKMHMGMVIQPTTVSV